MTREDIPPPTEFGEVSPCRRIAEKYHVDWTGVLAVMHVMVHHEYTPSHDWAVAMIPEDVRGPVQDDCQRVADRTRAQHRWSEEHPCVFVGGEWTEVVR